MRINILGAGAMGSLFGGLLAEAGREVCLVDIWAEHVAAVNDSGLSIEHEEKTRTIRLRAVTRPREAPAADLVVVFVKSTDTPKAAEVLGPLLSPSGLVLTLQNGMGNADALCARTEAARVLAGSTSHGATLLGPGRIRHAGRGPTVIGSWQGNDERPAERVAAIFSQAGIETTVSEDIREVLWNKLLINVGINAITALTGIRNGQLLDLECTRELSRAAVREAMAVARARGVRVRDDMAEVVFQVAAATGPNRSSMGQDVDHRRRTEIKTINGVIVAESRKLGLAAPVNQTLTALVETLQGHYD